MHLLCVGDYDNQKKRFYLWLLHTHSLYAEMKQSSGKVHVKIMDMRREGLIFADVGKVGA